MFLLIICKFHDRHPDHTYFPFLPGPLYQHFIPLQKKNIPGKIWAARILIRAWPNSLFESFLYPHSESFPIPISTSPEVINYEELELITSILILRDPPQWPPFSGSMREVGCHRRPQFFFFNSTLRWIYRSEFPRTLKKIIYYDWWVFYLFMKEHCFSANDFKDFLSYS